MVVKLYRVYLRWLPLHTICVSALHPGGWVRQDGCASGCTTGSAATTRSSPVFSYKNFLSINEYLEIFMRKSMKKFFFHFQITENKLLMFSTPFFP